MMLQITAIGLVPQGGSQKSKVKSQKALILGFLAVMKW
jgi:hypothetical protein